MSAVSAEMVKTLREKTGVGMMDCKKALVEADGDLDKAQELLRKKGLAAASQRGGRATAEGIVSSYIHTGNQVGVMLEINCETDFVARNEAFQQLAKDLAMHIAASSPQYVSREQVPVEVINKEKEILLAQPDMAKKPENMKDKIVTGRLEKFYEQFCLLDQPFVKEQSLKVQEVINQKAGVLGEHLVVRRFARFAVGEVITGS